MSIEVQILGKGALAGRASSIDGYRIVEDAGPISLDDSSGGVGSIQFSAIDDPSRMGTALLLNSKVKLSDTGSGVITGNVSTLSSDGGIVKVDANSRLESLVIRVDAGSVYTTFGDALRYYLALGGIEEQIAVHNTLEDIPVVAPGWSGDLWTHIKQLCAYAGAESPILVRDVITVRPIRQRTIRSLRAERIGWASSYSDLARNVEVTNWNSRYVQDGAVYPRELYPTGSVYTVDAGEINVINIPVDFYIESLIQPFAQYTVGEEEIGSSVYAITDEDRNLVDPIEWTRDGGSVTYQIGPDRRSVNVIVEGARGMTGLKGPFRLGVPVGDKDYRTSLRIAGTGIAYREDRIEFATTAEAVDTSRASGGATDSIFNRSLDDAYQALQTLSSQAASPTMRLSVSGAKIKSVTDEDQPYNFATVGEFDAYADGRGMTDLASFDALYGNATFEDFDEFWYEQVEAGFSNQLFGNVAGARLPYRRAFYRIRTATIEPTGVDFEADEDTTFGDFDESANATDMTLEDFDELYEDLTFSDFAIIPLPNELPEYTIA